MKRNAGFSLTELMVSVGILAMVSLYMAEMLTRQSRTYNVVDEVVEVQQNVRAIADLIERDLRMTALMVPEAAAFCGSDNTNASDVVFVTDASAMDFTNENQVDLGAVISIGAPVAGTVNFTLDDVSIDGMPFYDLNVPPDGAADADFRPGGGVIVIDRANPNRGAACGIVTAGGVGANTVSVDFTVDFDGAGPLPALVPGGTSLAALGGGDNAPELVAIPAHVYAVTNNQLFRDGLVLAEDVEDLQVALFYDLDGDDLWDDDGDGSADDPFEYPGAGGVGAVQYTSNAYDNSDLREIRINFVVRTRDQDREFGEQGLAQGRFQATENRVAPAGNDGFRRRVYTATVRPRNVGSRVGS